MQRKHFGQIHNWADIDDCVVFVKTPKGSWVRTEIPTWNPKYKYRICIDPKQAHVYAAWLDGQTIQRLIDGVWEDEVNFSDTYNTYHTLFCPTVERRIKEK